MTPTSGPDPFDTVDPPDRRLADASAAFDGEGVADSPPSDEAERFLAAADTIRAALRSRPPAESPDLVAGVLGALDASESRERRPWPAIAAVAASFLIGLVAAAVLLLGDDFEGELVAATEFEVDTRGALNVVVELDAAVTLVERGVHPDLPERRYEGRLRYRAPEESSLTLTEVTELPPGWPANDVEVVVVEDRAWRSRRLACPVESMPSCLGDPAIDGIEGRAPFSSGWAAPLEMVVPVESVRDASIARTDDSMFTALTTVDRAAPLLATTIENGAFRQVHADDQVEIRLDARDRTLLGFSIRAADTAARLAWATTWGYADEAGDEVFRLEVVADGISTPVPEAPAGGLSAGGFVDGPVAVDGVAAALPDGYALHRTGTLTIAGSAATTISAWADGRAWITIRSRVSESRVVPPGFAVLERDGRTVLVDDAARIVMIMTLDERVVIEGSAPLDRLVDLAFGLPYEGRAPDAGSSPSPQSTIRVGSTTVLVDVRPGRLLPPADRGDIVGVAVRGTVGRFSPTTGELTWVENGSVIALSGSGDLAVLLAAVDDLVVP